jgi:hypothetical protein
MNTALIADPNTTAESSEAVSSAENKRIQQEF